MNRVLIRNADVVLPNALVRTNVLIEGAKIAIDAPASVSANEVIQADGLVLFRD